MIWYDGTQFQVPPCCSQPGYFPLNMGLHHNNIAVEKVSTDNNNDKSTINCTGDRTKMVVCLLLHAIVQLSTLLTPAAFATNLALLLSLCWRLCCMALLSFCCVGWLLPVVLPLLLASLPCIPLLADSAVGLLAPSQR